MNPDYLWVTDGIQLLILVVVGPVLAVAIAYATWRGEPQKFTPTRYVVACVVCGAASFLLFTFAKWMNADVRTAQYFLQLALALLSSLLFWCAVGCAFPVFYICGVGTRRHD